MNQFSSVRSMILVIALPVLASCASDSRQHPEMPAFSPRYTGDIGELFTHNGSIYSAQTSRGLYEDIKAYRVGDIVTILLVEQTSGQNSANSNMSQSTEVNVSAPTVGDRNFPRLGVNLDSENSFNGQNGNSQSNSLSGSITVTVTRVLPNGNLVVDGEKWVSINQRNEYVRLKGVVRQQDVTNLNTVQSTQVADAQISYGGHGVDGNKQGWASKIVFSSLWPF